MRGFVEHIERCEKCQEIEDENISEDEKDMQQYNHFRDSTLDAVGMKLQEWKDNKI